MRNNPRDIVSVTEASIRTMDGKMHWIDPRAMLAAMDRAHKYLEEAVRWGKERASHLKSGNKKQDTRRHDQFLQRQHLQGSLVPHRQRVRRNRRHGCHGGIAPLDRRDDG